MVAAIVQLRQYKSEKPEKKKGGVITKPNSNSLYIDIYPYGERFQTSSGLPNTPENLKKLQNWVDGLKTKIEEGTFVFAEAFPNASEKKKAFYAQVEGRVHRPEAQQYLFGDYLTYWSEKNLPDFDPNKKKYYEGTIRYWIKPFFQHMTFDEITGITLRDFIKKLKHKSGPNTGEPLSSSRVNGILLVLRAVWFDALEEYQWDRSDPFTFIKRFLREDKKTRPQSAKPEVFRFDEWMKIVESIHPHYRPMIEFMIRTGLSNSEISGLKRSAVKTDGILVENSIVLGYEKTQLKNQYRRRKVPLTKKLKEILDLVMARSDSEYLFLNLNGKAPKPGDFVRSVWRTAIKRADVPYRVPYTMRHSFAAWSLALDIHPNRLVKLMGHGSKKMVYEVYGKYVEGLENDNGKIQEYFGHDFG
ncbi:MAG: tyrosine-type recombinase/integrase [Desulfobacteraceae bacterium]|nr:tyrosine-type recombinase/integrase [Desulfobacteraceae bacterium]